ncbi:MAG TPA: ester cyclase [Polyangiaceae bacterium]
MQPIASENERVVRSLYEDCINRGELSRLRHLVSDEFLGPRGERGPDGFAEAIRGLLHAFPNIRFTVDDVFGEGDRVAIRWTWRGTHENAFRSYAPTHQQVETTAIAIYQLRDGKIVRTWLQSDRLGVLQQLGVVPRDVSPPLSFPEPHTP